MSNAKVSSQVFIVRDHDPLDPVDQGTMILFGDGTDVYIKDYSGTVHTITNQLSSISLGTLLDVTLSGLTTDPTNTSHVLRFDANTSQWINDDLNLSVVSLSDTPSTLGTPGQVLAVNSTSTGTEWVTPSSAQSVYTGIAYLGNLKQVYSPVNYFPSGAINIRDFDYKNYKIGRLLNASQSWTAGSSIFTALDFVTYTEYPNRVLGGITGCQDLKLEFTETGTPTASINGVGYHVKVLVTAVLASSPSGGVTLLNYTSTTRKVITQVSGNVYRLTIPAADLLAAATSFSNSSVYAAHKITVSLYDGDTSVVMSSSSTLDLDSLSFSYDLTL